MAESLTHLGEAHEANEAKYDQSIKLPEESEHHNQKVEDVTQTLRVVITVVCEGWVGGSGG